MALQTVYLWAALTGLSGYKKVMFRKNGGCKWGIDMINFMVYVYEIFKIKEKIKIFSYFLTYSLRNFIYVYHEMWPNAQPFPLTFKNLNHTHG